MGSKVGLVPVAYGFNGGIGSGGFMGSMVGLVPVALWVQWWDLILHTHNVYEGFFLLYFFE
jgi:hypothetical protein